MKSNIDNLVLCDENKCLSKLWTRFSWTMFDPSLPRLPSRRPPRSNDSNKYQICCDNIFGRRNNLIISPQKIYHIKAMSWFLFSITMCELHNSHLYIFRFRFQQGIMMYFCNHLWYPGLAWTCMYKLFKAIFEWLRWLQGIRLPRWWCDQVLVEVEMYWSCPSATSTNEHVTSSHNGDNNEHYCKI